MDEEEKEEYEKCFAKGQKLFKKGNWEKALEFFKKSLQLNQDSWQAWYNTALVYYELGDKERALKCLIKTLDLQPEDVDALLNLASIHVEKKRYRKAIPYLTEALTVSEMEMDAWMLLGKILRKLEFPAYALFSFNQVAELSEDEDEIKKGKWLAKKLVNKHPGIKPRDPREKKNWK
ncbi:MAG: tetratricopeptide repeat protein [Candidatus Hodarchaeota archaeon]